MGKEKFRQNNSSYIASIPHELEEQHKEPGAVEE